MEGDRDKRIPWLFLVKESGVQGTSTAPFSIRLAEVMAALSLATDLGMGQPLEFALCSCLLAVRLAEQVGLPEATLHAVYYQALLRYIGCNADTYLLAAIVGDELALRSEYARVDTADTPAVLGLVLRHIRRAQADESSLQAIRSIAQGLVTLPSVTKQGFAGHCEVAQRLAERFGFQEEVIAGLGQLYERWDGRGAPRGLKGEAIAPAVLVVALAQDVITFSRMGGVEAAVALARERRGAAYDPRLVDAFCRQPTTLLAGLETEPTWDAVLASEPGARVSLSDDRFDAVCQAIADFADIKSPYLLGHSSGVAELAAEAARWAGLPASDVRAVRQAGYLHDVGRVGISAGIWGKPGPLSDGEWERVRLHPYYTERVLARPRTLAPLGALAALHHERLDGSGYHRGLPGRALAPTARLLAAADVYHALTEPRPHRPARSPEVAADLLRREAHAGRLDGEVVRAVLAAAGHRVGRGRRELVAGLSARELEVLRLLARGHSLKQIAARLFIAEKTADNHVQHTMARSASPPVPGPPSSRWNTSF